MDIARLLEEEFKYVYSKSDAEDATPAPELASSEEAPSPAVDSYAQRIGEIKNKVIHHTMGLC